jgi:hypothetical protein
MTSEPRNVFSKLRSDASAANPRPPSLVNKVHPNPKCCLEYRLDVNEDKAYLVAYCPAKSLPSPSKWPNLKAFEIKQRSVGGRDCLAVSVLKGVLNSDLAMAEELLSVVGSYCQPGLDPAEAVEDMLGCLAKAQNLTKGRGQPLSLDKQVGLLGELYVLRSIIIPKVGGSQAISDWSGPDGAPQDFQCKKCAIEVKSTRGNLPQTIHVSSARQLQADTVERLFLVRIALDSQPNVGLSLPDMVAKVELDLSGNSMELLKFRDKLAEVGYYADHAPLYEQPKYQVRSLVFYDVKAGFPRLQEKDLPPGIGELSYEIEMGACAGFVVDEAEVGKSFD